MLNRLSTISQQLNNPPSKSNCTLLHCIRRPHYLLEVSQQANIRYLKVNGIAQSLMHTEDHTLCALPYVHFMLLPHSLFNSKLQVLELGLGGGSMIRQLLEYHPDSEITSIEQSADIIDVFNHYFNPDKLNLSIIHADAFEWVKNAKNNRYNWILVDMFVGEETAMTLFSSSFLTELANLCHAGGWISINSVCRNDDEQHALQTKLEQVFKPEQISCYPIPQFLNRVWQITL